MTSANAQPSIQISKDDLVVLETHGKEVVIAKIVDISAENFSVQKLDDNSLVSIPRSHVARVRTASVATPIKPASPKVEVQAIEGTPENPFIIG